MATNDTSLDPVHTSGDTVSERQQDRQLPGNAALRVSQEKQGFSHLEKQSSGSLENQPPPQEDDPVEVKRIIRKIDYRLVPMLMAMYTLTFLDRVNIGNARLWHLEADLNMTGYDYNIVVLVFYIPYILLEIPSNMLLSRVKPRYYLSGLMLGWGCRYLLPALTTMTDSSGK